MKRTFFTLTSARSGTLCLRDLFRNNVPDCACRHEPFYDWGNPTLFGPAIYDAYAGRLDRVRARLAKKRGYVERLRQSVYLESSHAFLKSLYVAALEFFPDLRLIHLVRDPLYVAKSEAWREEWRERIHAPFHFYVGDDHRLHFCWALTGNERIFQHFDRQRLSLFQWYLIQWIEIENRAMRFLEDNQLRDRCFTLHCSDLNNASRIREMFEFFELPTAHERIIPGGSHNRIIGHRTVVTAEDERQCEEILNRMPDHYLEIFRREPYTGFQWSKSLANHKQTNKLQPVISSSR